MPAVAIGDVGEDVEVTTVGTPRGQLHPGQGRTTELDWKQGRLFVGQAFDTQAGMQIAHGRGQPIEVLPTWLRDAVDVEGRSLGAVGASSNASDQQVLDIVAGEDIEDSLQVRPWSAVAVKLPERRVPGGLFGLDLGSHVGPPGEHGVLAVKATAVASDRHIVRSRGEHDAALELLKTHVDDPVRHVPRLLRWLPSLDWHDTGAEAPDGSQCLVSRTP